MGSRFRWRLSAARNVPRSRFSSFGHQDTARTIARFRFATAPTRMSCFSVPLRPSKVRRSSSSALGNCPITAPSGSSHWSELREIFEQSQIAASVHEPLFTDRAKRIGIDGPVAPRPSKPERQSPEGGKQRCPPKVRLHHHLLGGAWTTSATSTPQNII